MESTKYPPLTTASLVSYNHLGPFSEVVLAEKMAELERKLAEISKYVNEIDADDNSPYAAQAVANYIQLILK